MNAYVSSVCSSLFAVVVLVTGQDWPIDGGNWKSEALGLKCFACPMVVTPEECEQTTICSMYEECVTKEIIVGDNIFYSLGCKHEKVCDVLREFEPSGIHGECERCCTTPYCNSHLCKTFDLRQLQCQTGSGLSDPSQAQEVLSCSPGQVCYSARVKTDEKNIRFYLGCAAQKACENSTDMVYYMKPAISSSEDILCTDCCSESFCNTQLCTG